MAITVANVITKTRKYLADAQEERTWDDTADFIPSVNRAQRKVKRERPDLMMADDGTLTAYADATAVGDTLIWDDDQLEALAHYTAFDLLLDDTVNRSNREEAATRLQLFESEIS